MDIIRYPDKTAWTGLLKRPVLDSSEVDSLVTPILNDVRNRGDIALLEYTRKFDKAELSALAVTMEEFDYAEKMVDAALKEAIAIAVRNIEVFHRAQQIIPGHIQTAPGVECWQKSVAIQKVGLYVPGGTAPLFSTVLMLAVPARIAGCSEIVLCSPPDSRGRLHPALLYAARITGVTRVFKVGGAQAIAALAFGTETIPKVYKIFGPGNQFVTAAKQLVSRNDVAIDMPAGPSELAVIADDTANPAYVASDLLSQAEHGIDSQVMLVATHESTVDQTLTALKKQLQVTPRKEIAEKALENSRFILMNDLDQAIDLINDYAPEHLILASDKANEIADRIINAGSVFLGHYTPESAGDYASGTNHTLPTSGYARTYNGVNLDDFVKKITFQQITREGLINLGPVIMKMAAAETLAAHKNAVEIRLK